MSNTRRNRVQRAAAIKWVPITAMRVSQLAQRDLRQPRVDKLADEFDLEQLGTPTVNERDGGFYIIDGQHRIEALRKIGWSDQQVQCWAYEGLSEEEEAEMFLKLNDVLTVDPFSKFRIGVQAGRAINVDIDAIVRSVGLVVARDAVEGAIRAVTTLERIYKRSGPATLTRTLLIARDAYGSSGMGASTLEGISLVCHRYGDLVNDEALVRKLRAMHGGVSGLLNRAEVLRQKTGNAKGACVAAAIVEVANRGRGMRLAGWWKADEEDD